MDESGETKQVDETEGPPAVDKRPPNSVNYEEEAGFFSLILFSFVYPVIKAGHKRLLQWTDLWKIRGCDTAGEVKEKVFSGWELDKEKKAAEGKTPRLLHVLRRIHKAKLSLAFVFRIIEILLNFTYPFIVGRMINYVEDDDAPTYEGFIYVAVLFILPILSGVAAANSIKVLGRIAFQVRSGVMSVIYRKTMTMSLSEMSHTNTGEIQNLMSSDAERMLNSVMSITNSFLGPITIVAALIMLYITIGVAAIVGFLVMVILLAAGGVVGGRLIGYQRGKLLKADQRVKMTNEVLLAIRIIKFFAWEQNFEDRVLALRNEEGALLKKFLFNHMMFKAMIFITPLFVSFATFSTFVALGGDLTAEKVFVAVAYLNIIRFPMVFTPISIVSLMQGKVSLDRVDRFLHLDDVTSDVVLVDGKENDSHVNMENVTAAWRKKKKADDEKDSVIEESDVKVEIGENAESESVNENENASGEDTGGEDTGGEDEVEVKEVVVLRDFNLQVKRGQCVGVVGPVGCGKSSLLECILGEMICLNGTISRAKSVAYVPQQAWIMNATVRDNVTFGLPVDEERYQKVIRACCLEDDIETLAGGHYTEIGEKGINLSGGQKARLSLARACYTDADLYLLDDPLSAVDAHVGRKLVDQVILGLLREKTVILVTQQLHVLPQLDSVCVIQNETIVGQGTYEELLSKGLDFKIMMHGDKDDEDGLDGEMSKEEDGLGLEGGSVGRKLSSVRRASIKQDKVQMTEVEEQKKGELVKEEERGTGRKSSAILHLYVIAAGGMLVLMMLFLAYLVAQALFVGCDIWLTLWIGKSVGDYSDGFYIGIYAAFTVSAAIAMVLRGLLFQSTVFRAAMQLHVAILKRVLRFPTAFFDETPTGRILNRFSKDTAEIDELFPDLAESWLLLVAWELGAIAVIILITPFFVVALIPMAIIYHSIQRIYIPSSREVQRLVSISRSPVFAQFSETLNGLSVIRGFGKVDMFMETNAKLVDDNTNPSLVFFFMNRWLDVRLQGINSILVGFAALFIVLQRDSVDAAFVGLSLTTAMSVLNLLTFVVLLTALLESRLACVDRIVDYSERPIEPPAIIEDHRPSHEWPPAGEVSFTDVRMRYRPELEDVLTGVTFTIKPKEKIGVVGRTGSGKSSLLIALFRMRELSGGNITIDGVDAHSIGLLDLRSRMTVIPQDPVMFSGTLRSNLDPFAEHEDAEIWEVLEWVQLKDRICEREDQLEATVAEYGKNFSVGERQLLCLARALLKKAKIILLDEATSDVDPENDLRIQKVIREKFVDSTVITIAHRLNTIIDCDRVLVMRHGKVAEFASPADLLDDPHSVFAALVDETGPQMSRLLKKIAHGESQLFAHVHSLAALEEKIEVGEVEVRGGVGEGSADENDNDEGNMN